MKVGVVINCERKNGRLLMFSGFSKFCLFSVFAFVVGEAEAAEGNEGQLFMEIPAKSGLKAIFHFCFGMEIQRQTAQEQRYNTRPTNKQRTTRP